MTTYRECFAEAARAAANGAVVLTGNQRSSRAVRTAAEAILRASRAAWPTPSVLPFAAFIEQLHQQAQVAALPAALPLDAEQEAQLWRQIIERSPGGRRMMLPERAAALAAQSFRTAVEYGLPLDSAQMSASSETRAFAGWAAEFRRQLAANGWSCAALLASEVTPLLGQLRLPREVVAFIPEPTPAQRDFLAALAEAGVRVISASDWESALQEEIVRHPFDSAEDELRAAAEWARRTLEQTPSARVGVIILDLKRRRAQVESAFRAVLHPESLLGVASPAPFEVAAALPLAEYSVVRTALDLLAFIAGGVDFHDFEAMLASPYLKLGPEAAAKFTASIRQQARLQVSAADVRGWLADPNHEWLLLQALLTRLPEVSPAEQGAAQWAAMARELLRMFGWPDGAALNSQEYQCTGRWRELLDQVAALELLAWRGSFAQFVAALRRASSAQEFKPETLGAPVQIMDAHEAAGSVFDALWIGSCSDQLWPAAQSAPALLPVSMLADAGFPLAGSAAEQARTQQATARLLDSAPQVVLSLALRGDDEGEQRWAPRFAGFELSNAPAPMPSLMERFAPAALESLSDSQAPALEADEAVRGGTWLIADQSKCPFRAFAIRRLLAGEEQGPNEALTRLERGKLVELALQRLWERWQGSDALARPGREEAIAQAVDAALAEKMPDSGSAWSRRFRALERARTLELLRQWLQVEETRAPFRVLGHQQEVRFELAGLPLHGYLDRVDEVNGARLVIDYKTGAGNNVNEWKVPRPAAPQLPLYVLAMREQQVDVAGAAIAQARKGECALSGYAREGALPQRAEKSKSFGMDFGEYIALWKSEMEELATAFVRGAAAVDPKIPPGKNGSPCERCHLEQLCRVSEPDDADDSAQEVGDE